MHIKSPAVKMLFFFHLSIFLLPLTLPVHAEYVPFIPVLSGDPVLLRFHYIKGDKYRVISSVDEDVYINQRYSHSARIVNRIAFSVKDTRDDGAALLNGDFSTSVKYGGAASYLTDRIYKSEYWLLPNGSYEIAPQYYMPTVRNVPSLPETPIKPGDKWSAPAEERHDFRDDFGIAEPYVIPVDVNYEYEGQGIMDGQNVHRLRASYTVFYRPGRPLSWRIAYPVQIAGYSDQILYWDAQKGGLAAYEERFRFTFDLSDGRTVEYRGAAASRVTEAELMDRSRLAEEIKEAVKDIKDVSVKTDEQGVTISLDRVQFLADSSILLLSEKEKIASISEILKNIKNRDILVSGHTALAGTASARKQLSEDRARAVADYLIELGARKAEAITVIGYGAEKPVAPNDTESNMAKNRRVEITILEN